MEPRYQLSRGPTRFNSVEGNITGRQRECSVDSARSETLACADAPCTEPGDLGLGRRSTPVPHWEGEEP